MLLCPSTLALRQMKCEGYDLHTELSLTPVENKTKILNIKLKPQDVNRSRSEGSECCSFTW